MCGPLVRTRINKSETHSGYYHTMCGRGFQENNSTVPQWDVSKVAVGLNTAVMTASATRTARAIYGMAEACAFETTATSP